MSSHHCRICLHGAGTTHLAPETMFGTGETFPYFECEECGALSALEIPERLENYYGRTYYSMASRSERSMRDYLRSGWDKVCAESTFRFRGRFEPLLSRLYRLPDPMKWGVFQKAGRDARIVDVGCGAGLLLRRLAGMGFNDLTGLDPFMDESLVDKGPAVRMVRAGIEDLDESFDLIMFHHSFEHVLEEEKTLAAARDHLKPGGQILLRVPLAQSDAWNTYGVAWVQLDPPRHIVLHTPASIELLASRVGLRVADTIYDSTGFQFWGSEQFQAGIPVQSAESYAVSPRISPWSAQQLDEFDRRAVAANRIGRGDQAAFVLEML